MTLFGTLDIFYYFMSKDHHKRRCKAALNQTFQWPKQYIQIQNLCKPGGPKMWFDPYMTIISSRKSWLMADLQSFVRTT